MTTADGGAARVTRSQATTVVRESIRFALGIGLTGLLGRGLDDASFGFVTFIGTIYALAHLVLDLGSGALLVREIGRDPSRERPLLEAATAWRGVVGLGAAMIVACVGLSESDPDRRLWTLIAAASLPFLAPAVVGVAFQTRQDLGPPSAIGVATQALAVGAAALLLDAKVVPATLAAIYVGREILGPATLWIVAKKRYGLGLRPGVFGRDTRRLFGAAATQAASVVFQTISFHAGVLAIKTFASDADVGVYSAAVRLVNPTALLVGALAAPLLPVFAAGYGTRRAATARLAGAACALGAAVAVAGVVAFACDPAGPLDLVYGEGRYASTGASPTSSDAVPALTALVFALGCVCVGATTTTALLADGGERTLRAVFGAGLLVNAACLSALAFGGGIVWAGAGFLLAEATILGASWTALRRRGGATFDRAAPLWCVATGAATFIAFLVFREFVPGRGAIAPVLAGAVGVAAVLIGPPGRAFRSALKGSGS